MKRIAEKNHEIRSTILFCFLVAIISILVGAYVSNDRPAPLASSASTASQPMSPANVQTESSTPAAAPPQMAAAPSQLKTGDIQEAVRRVYKDTVIAEPARSFFGDFNGDGSQDLAIVARPGVGMLPKINDELAMWELEDPRQVFAPSLNRRVRPLARKRGSVQASQSDLLLIVIHGNGPLGWRDAKANGTYLLKNGVGSKMSAQPLTQALQTLKGNEDAPSLRGDVIQEMLAGKPGFLFWTGALYSWYEIG